MKAFFWQPVMITCYLCSCCFVCLFGKIKFLLLLLVQDALPGSVKSLETINQCTAQISKKLHLWMDAHTHGRTDRRHKNKHCKAPPYSGGGLHKNAAKHPDIHTQKRNLHRRLPITVDITNVNVKNLTNKVNYD